MQTKAHINCLDLIIVQVDGGLSPAKRIDVRDIMRMAAEIV